MNKFIMAFVFFNFLLSLILFSPLFAVENRDSIGAKSQKFNFLKGQKTYIENPFKLRDPFKRPSLKKKRKINDTAKDRTIFSNVGSIAEVPLSKIKIVGVLVGKDRRAIAKVDGDKDKTFILKEGMKLGLNNAEIKAIMPGGIVLVEKIRNVYDQDEYLETIIPVSEE